MFCNNRQFITKIASRIASRGYFYARAIFTICIYHLNRTALFYRKKSCIYNWTEVNIIQICKFLNLEDYYIMYFKLPKLR